MSTETTATKPTRKPKTKFVKQVSLNPTEAKVLAIVLANDVNAATENSSPADAVYVEVLKGILAKLA